MQNLQVHTREGNDNYVVAALDRKRSMPLCHANLLKLYFEREGDVSVTKTAAVAGYLELTPLPSPLVAVSSGESAKCSSSHLGTSTSSPPAVAVLDWVDVNEPDEAVLLGRLKNSSR